MFTADRTRVLSMDECLRLLREHQHGVGRVAFDDGLPVIFPVNYVLDAGRIVFRSAGGSKIDAAADGRMMAFEIDSVVVADGHVAHAWSVLVRGRSSVVTDDDEATFLRLSRLEPSAGGLKPTYVTIDVDQVTGRRF
jgi:nitroimidazol reductase NimA-like FMN-containing flavoprotein (pyridoxamine 5'-phosphate oxidase superfamily)